MIRHTVPTRPTRAIIGVLGAVFIAGAVGTVAIHTDAAAGHGIALGALLGVDLLIGAGFLAALVAADSTTE